MSAAAPEKYNTLVRPQVNYMNVSTCIHYFVFIRETLLLKAPILFEGLPNDLTTE